MSSNVFRQLLSNGVLIFDLQDRIFAIFVADFNHGDLT